MAPVEGIAYKTGLAGRLMCVIYSIEATHQSLEEELNTELTQN
jgi:hypothetical protein